MKRILSIDGGGIRGVIPALVLETLEANLGKPCAEHFDMLAGTSTGGIIALGLLAGIPARELADLYIKRGAEIFSHADPLRGAVRPRYSAAPLMSLLRTLLGETWLSETKGPEVLIPSFCCNPRGAWFFKSWKARNTSPSPDDVPADLDFKLWQIALATSAAETYFPTAEIESKSGKRMYFMDGGTHSNNPAVAALASAINLWGLDDIHILSIGTGTGAAAPIDGPRSQFWGAVEWVTEGKIIDVCMDGVAEVVDYQLQCLANRIAKVTRLQVTLPPEATAMDNASPENIARLETVAQQLISANLTDLKL